MVAEADFALQRNRRVRRHIRDGEAVFAGHADRLVEVAVVQGAVPRHRKLRAAHHRRDGFLVESPDQRVHVAAHVVRLEQPFAEAAAGCVGDGEQVVEVDVEIGLQLRLVLRLERFLLGREKRTERVEHQVELELFAVGSGAFALAVSKRAKVPAPRCFSEVFFT